MASQHLREPLGVERADALIRDAVCRRLDADAPLGCFLSGGIDSALIAHYAIEKLGRLDTFTVRMPSAAYDESDAAKETSAQLGTTHHTLDCNIDPAADLVKMIEHMGVPFGDSSLLPTFWVARAASKHVKVALSGDGGDELFCGYERHRVPSIMKGIPRIVSVFPSGAVPDRDPKAKASKIRRLLSLMKVSQSSVGPELTAIFPRHDLKSLLLCPSTDWDACDAVDARSRRSASPRAWDVDEYLTGDLLRKTDCASMAVPIEVRCPFLDPRLAEATLGTPLGHPHAQRRTQGPPQTSRPQVPPPTKSSTAPSRASPSPSASGFRTDYGGMRQLLLDHLRSTDPFPGLADAGVHIKMAFVERMIREHDAAGEKSINPWHGRDHSQRLYMLLVLSIWAKWLDRVRRGG
jgi:asparagine synthase (glutamine-hydrolysing)